MGKSLKKTEPFGPIVTIEEVYAFDPQREETFTRSLLLNAVLTAVRREGLTTQKEVADYLKVRTAHLGGAVRIVLGMSFNQMRDLLLRHVLERLQAEHPDWGSGELAAALGYSDTSSLWRLLHREHDHKYYKEWHDASLRREEESRQELIRQWREEHGNQ